MHTTKSLQRVLIVIGLLSLGIVAHATLPAVNTPIGNQAKASYTDSSNVVREVFSNTVVTRVSAVYALDLVQNNGRTATPGGQVFFAHSVINNGNDNDTIALSGIAVSAGVDFELTGIALYPDADRNGLPDNFTPITTTGVVAPGAEFHFVVTGVVPQAQSADKVARITVTATSAADNTQTDNNTDTVTVTNNAAMTVTKSSDKASGLPGTTPVTYTITYTNSGNSAATNFTLTDLVPAGMTYVPSSARWSVLGSGVTLTDTDKTDNQSGITYDYGVTAAGKATFVIATVNPGQSGFVTLAVSVNTPIVPQILNNSVDYIFTSGGSLIGPFTSNRVPFNVGQSAGVTLGDDLVANVSAGSSATFSNLLTNIGTGTDAFDIRLTSSTFSTGTTYQFFQNDGQTPMTDTNGNGVPDTGPVAPGGTYNVVVKATVPSTASGNNAGAGFVLVKTATSTFDNTVSDPGTDTLTAINGSSVDLTNVAVAGSAGSKGDGYQSGDANVAAQATHSANPGTTSLFTLYVTNTGPTPDSFNLLADKDGTFGSVSDLPVGWTVVFKLGGSLASNTGVIASGASVAMTAEIFVPANATPATQPIYFQAVSPVTGALDSIHDAVATSTVRNVTIQTDNVGQTYPGGSVVYEHILRNNGNVVEGDGAASTLVFSLTDTLASAGFTSVLYYDKNDNGSLDSSDPVVSILSATGVKPDGLAPGQSLRLFVKAFAPLGAADSSSNATRVTVTPSGIISSVAAPPVVYNTDATTVVRGDLTLLKEQAIDINGNGTIDGGEGPFTVNQLHAAPGKVIIYRITVSNTGAVDATAVTINDSTPANTTYFKSGAQGIANVNGNATLARVPTAPAIDGSTGPLVFVVGTLAPNASAVITFGVKINQ